MDACKNGWVAVALADRTFREARELARAQDALAVWPDLAVLAIDIPIGLPDARLPYPRVADGLAAQFIGRRRSSVFMTPPFDVIQAPTYAEAVARMRLSHPVGLSRQSYALRRKILEVNELAVAEPRVYEVHPEVSFRAMAGDSMEVLAAKKTWNGHVQRRRLLLAAGITIPEALPHVPTAAADDVLDAAAAAWSAWRIATGTARTLPDPPQEGAAITRIAIHY